MNLRLAQLNIDLEQDRVVAEQEKVVLSLDLDTVLAYSPNPFYNMLGD